MEIFWDIWYYFILYVIWIFFAFEILYKLLFLKELKKQLGNDINSYPDVSKIKLWRKILILFLIITAIAMIIFGIIYKLNYFYTVYILIMAALVYINGKLRNKVISCVPTIFWNDNGFSVYPIINTFKFQIFRWEDVEGINVNNDKFKTYWIIKSKSKEYKFIYDKKSQDMLQEIFSKYLMSN